MTEEKMISISEIYLNSDPNSGHMVVLKERPEAERYFMMFVGESEFAAIAKEKGLVQPKRPLTHEVYLHMMEKLRAEFLRIEIYDLREDTFYANVFFRADGTEHTIDSRPSDAVALALNRKIPILVNERLLRRELSQEEITEYEGIVKTIKF